MAELDLIIGNRKVEEALKGLEGKIAEPEDYVNEFMNMQTSYSGRNSTLRERVDLFEGKHWKSQTANTGITDVGSKVSSASANPKETEYELVLNYLRNATMRYAAMLSREATPHVPFPGPIESGVALSANKCERFLHAIWKDLWKVWRDVEMDACKLSYGVFQAIWAPFGGEPESVQVGIGEDQVTHKMYTKCPFRFKSVKPSNFYPIYRTFDTPNDFLTVYRFDPGRYIQDLEERYEVELQATDQDTTTLPTADLLEVWTKDLYMLVAFTREVQTSKKTRKSIESRSFYIIEAGKNPHKRIPFWVLQNIRTDAHENPTNGGSYADLDDIGELNKHLESMLSESAQEISTHIHSPIVYKSEDHLNDPTQIKFAPGAVFPIGAEEELDAMQWNPDPAGVGNHLDRIFSAIQDLSFLGEAGFGRLAAGMSGIGFKIALTPMEQVLELKLPNRIDTLKEICEYLLTEFKNRAGDIPFEGWVTESLGAYGLTTLGADEVPNLPTVEIKFPNLLPRDDQVQEQSEVYKWKTGAQSLKTTMHNIGIKDPVIEISRIIEELMNPKLSPDHVMKVKQLEMMDKQMQQQDQQQQQQAQGNKPLGGNGAGGAGAGTGGNGAGGAGQQGNAFGTSTQGAGGAPMQTMGGMGGIGGVPGGMGAQGGMGMGGPQGGMPGAGALPGGMSGVGMPPGAGGGGAGGGMEQLTQMMAGMFGGGGAGGAGPGGPGGPGGMPGGGTGPQMPLGQMGGANFPTQSEQPGARRNAPFMKRKR